MLLFPHKIKMLHLKGWSLFFFWWIVFSIDFLRLATEKMKIYRVEVWCFCKMHHWIPFDFSPFVYPGVKFFENMWNYLRIGPTSTKYLCWLTGDIFSCKPLQIMLNYVHWFFKIRIRRPPIFFAFLAQVTRYLTAVKIKQKSIDYKIFARTS